MKKININGVDYIRKEEFDKFKSNVEREYIKRDELNKIKSNIMELNKLIGVEKEEPKALVRTEVKKRTKRVPNKTFTPRSRDNRIFEPAPTTKIDLKIIGVDDNGHFIKDTNYKTQYTVRDVRYLRSQLTPRTTFKDIRRYARKIGIRPDVCRILVYNIRNGIFEKYI